MKPGVEATSSALTPAPSPAPSTAPPAPGAPLDDPRQHPLVQSALELFGGRIVDVQPRRAQ
jgi:hypothetical protein